jgi:hypothetical protein
MAERVNTFSAIATAYRGFNFRSRLEAKWAVFFDKCGWRWSYEPYDLNGWIPDFAVGERPTLVEIRPYFHEHEWSDQASKIAKSGHANNVILLGADPTWFCGVGEDVQIGWLLERVECPNCEEWQIWDLHFGVTEGNQKLGLCPMEGAWSNEIFKPPTNSTHPNKWSRVSPAGEVLYENWSFASNVAQWIKQ